YLFTLRGGRVSAELDIVSVDLASRTLVVTRNSDAPLVIVRDGEVAVATETGGRIGLYRHTRPSVSEWPLQSGLTVFVVSDGVAHAGRRGSRPFDVLAFVQRALCPQRSVHELADELLAAALEADRGNPQDDMSVIVLRLLPGGMVPPIRRLWLSVPLAE
ncbi:MAG: serine/threonine-protein phosphatase, partial [Thermomicrobium sp.]|nr:serine/threonine-protein phosphatase [Thermomicrobium sp.]